MRAALRRTGIERSVQGPAGKGITSAGMRCYRPFARAAVLQVGQHHFPAGREGDEDSGRLVENKLRSAARSILIGRKTIRGVAGIQANVRTCLKSPQR